MPGQERAALHDPVAGMCYSPHTRRFPMPNSCQPFPSFIELAETRYGRMLFPKGDQYVGRSLREYGQFSHGEVQIFQTFVRPGAVVLDIGANIGAHTVPLAQLAGRQGVVVAFEPQPVLHQILTANLVLNSIPNTLTYAMALGAEMGTCRIPVLDYGADFNFGGVGMNQVAEGEEVPLATVDSFELDRVDFLKLDVEGFEVQVLQGGAETIRRCRPVLYVENDREENSAALIQALFDLGYRLWWHTPPLFSPENFRGNTDNVFGNLCSLNMLGIHRSQRPIEGLTEIVAPTDSIRQPAGG